MDGGERREIIQQTLAQTNMPISASKFAKEFQVSRQIIVGDIALLRASGVEVTATARGYLLDYASDKTNFAKIVCQHSPADTQKELEIIVSCGGEIVDVSVEHPIYGELSGKLEISNIEEVRLFMEQYLASGTSLLSELTEGVHLHTIRYTETADLEEIKQRLAAAGILYEGQH